MSSYTQLTCLFCSSHSICSTQF